MSVRLETLSNFPVGSVAEMEETKAPTELSAQPEIVAAAAGTYSSSISVDIL